MKKKKLFISNKNMPDEIVKSDVFIEIYVTNPHIVFYVFTPIAILLLAVSIYLGLSVNTILIGLITAVLFWTIFEYSLHRFLFHWKPQHPYLAKWMYTVHHGHHEYPNDKRLMLVHPKVSLLAYSLIGVLTYFIVGKLAFPFMAGVAICYMFYDWLHYASHFYNFDNKVFQILKKHHLHHHYTNNNKNFGFTSKTWDYILNTLLSVKKRKSNS